MRVEVQIEEVDDVGDHTFREWLCLPGGFVSCDGTGPKSRVRCIMLMREECEMGESNFYVDADGDDDAGPPSDPIPKPWWEK